MSSLLWLGLALGFCSEGYGQSKLYITEFMADNETTLKDDLGEFSDWLEIYNGGDEPVNLGGYFLTDDPAELTQWRFPATNLPPRRFLLVYASGHNRSIPGAALHTNFRLSATGEYLALVQPDGISIVSQYAFGPQAPGISLGLSIETTNEISLLPKGAVARVLVPTSNIGLTWIQPGFDDLTWLPSTTAIGFETNATTPAYKDLIQTDLLGRMFASSRPSAYLRVPFVIQAMPTVADVEFRMRYDDGFAAYLNGKEIARRNAAAISLWSSSATAAHANTLAVQAEVIPAPAIMETLVPGTNYLAIHGLNRAGGDADFLISPELLARDIIIYPDRERYFSAPTPGAANSPGVPDVSGPVVFSREGGTFTNSFSLTLSLASPVPGATIRYTLDRSLPSGTSPIYSVPLTVTNTVQVRARAFEPGNYPGPARTESYLLLQPSVLNFSSDLPVIILHTMGGGTITDASEKPGYLEIHDTFRGRSSLTSEPQIRTRAAAKVRGSSTGNQAKKALTVEFWDELNGPRDLAPLGMPAESDWILYPPNNAEPVLIHNPYAYTLYSELGRYSVRTRFVELYLNEQGGPISAANYVGIYVLTEKIKIGPDRVDIEPLEPSDRTPPAVTGGYLFKIDRRDPGDAGFNGAGADLGGIGPCYVDPKESEIKTADRDPQEQYVNSFFSAFGTALAGANFANPTTGYAKYVDVDSAIDFHLLSALTFTVDANVLSTFFYKPRDGKLTFGPPWDFDRSMGSLDPGFERDKSPRVWAVQTYLFHMPWWDRMFSDPNFYQRWIDRYQELRRGLFSVQHLIELTDHFAAQVREAQVREVARWPGFTTPRRGTVSGAQGYFFSFGNAGYQGEIDQMKHWLRERVTFMDGNFVGSAAISATGGPIAAGFTVKLSAPVGASVYYTLDGSDPRLPGGSLNPRALLAAGPIVLSENARVFARSRNTAWRAPTGGFNPVLSSPWSGFVAETFYLTVPALVVTEIMYHPASPATPSPFSAEDFEYVELKNIGSIPLSLRGVSFTNGIEFAFPDRTLQPSATILIVRHRAAFESRYGARDNIAGEYLGDLDNQSDHLALVGALREPILDFEYQADWHPLTDGYGFSLAIRDEHATPDTWGLAAGWKVSGGFGGSPGLDDPTTLIPAIVINEILPLASANGQDTVELFNPTGGAVDVGGWYLTDNADLPGKFHLRSGLQIPPGGYLVLGDQDLIPSPGRTNRFGLDRDGEEILLFSASPDGTLTGYRTGFRFEAAESGVSFGRHPVNADLVPGQFDYPAQRVASLGGPNAGPRVGPVVINEIHYRPPDVLTNGAYWDAPEAEFIEIKNVTQTDVSLFDPERPANTWRLRTAVNFEFPIGTTLPPQGMALIVTFDPVKDVAMTESFRAQYGLSPAVAIYGPARGKLDNSSERVSLLKPGLPNPTNQTDVPYIVVDQVQYQDSRPWPLPADGYGASLQRLDALAYGNDPGNWVAALPTPARANRGTAPAPSITSQPAPLTVVGGQSGSFSVSATGQGPLFYQWLFEGRVLNGHQAATLTLSNVSAADVGDYTVVVYQDGGFVESIPAPLSMVVPARILVPPASLNVNAGTNVMLRVSAEGQGELRYQWRLNDKPIPGATNDVLLLASVSLSDQGAYSVIVTDDIGSVPSPPGLLTVLLRPVIILQPQPTTAVVGETVTLSFAAYGTPPLWYRWRRDVSFLGGYVTNSEPYLFSTLTLTNVQPGHQAIYQVQFGNVALPSSFSSAVRLGVVPDLDADGIDDQWETIMGLNPGNPIDSGLDLDQDGLSALQEYRAGTDPNSSASRLSIESISLAEGRSVISFTVVSNRTYSIQFRESLQRGDWVTLTNIPSRLNSHLETFTDPRQNSATRWYRITAPQQPRTVASPIILASPRSTRVSPGSPVTFEVVAEGLGALRYQWFRDGAAVSGATAPFLSISQARPSDVGVYSVTVSDFLGTSLSLGAELEITDGP